MFRRHPVSNQLDKRSPDQLWAVRMDMNWSELTLRANTTCPVERSQSFLRTFHTQVFHGLLYLYLPLKPWKIAHCSPTVHSSDSGSFQADSPSKKREFLIPTYQNLVQTNHLHSYSGGFCWPQHPPSKAHSCLRWWGSWGRVFFFGVIGVTSLPFGILSMGGMFRSNNSCLLLFQQQYCIENSPSV